MPLVSGRMDGMAWLNETGAHDIASCQFCRTPLKQYRAYMVWRPDSMMNDAIATCEPCGRAYESALRTGEQT